MVLNATDYIDVVSAEDCWEPPEEAIEIGELAKRLADSPKSQRVDVIYKRGTGNKPDVKESFTGANAMSPQRAWEYIRKMIDPNMEYSPRSCSYCMGVPTQKGYSVIYGLNMGNPFEERWDPPFIHIDLIFQQ